MRKTIILLTICLTIALIQSCSTTRSTRRVTSTRGKLSTALEKAEDDHDGNRVIGKRKVKSKSQSHCEEEDEEDESIGFTILRVLFDNLTDDDNEDETKEQNESNDYPANDTNTLQTTENTAYRAEHPVADNNLFGFKIGSGVVDMDELYGINRVEGYLGGYFKDSRSALTFSLGITNSPVQEDAQYQESLSGGVNILNLDLTFRKYTTPHYTFLGNYFFAGTGMSYMWWKYKNTLQIEEYNEWDEFVGYTDISGDQLWGLNLFAGIGFNLIQTKNLHIGAELAPGITFWAPETEEGLSNNVFDSFKYLRLSFILNFISAK